ncbi:MAG: FemAB family PEP-CTERM system-associated protein [Deltaproteobacteria bacterium]|nr:FemAB family PEP-CTERM system-associated protein [Deltaproteobacteria bacterium]
MLKVVPYEDSDAQAWDYYVFSHPEGTCYHLTEWKRAVEKAYGHKSYYLIARNVSVGGTPYQEEIVGILPFFHLNHLIFGNTLVSLPFCDYGGVLSDSEKVHAYLLRESISLAEKLNNAKIEFRNAKRAAFGGLNTSFHKVRMVLKLNGNSDALWKSFEPKLRSQIRKPHKEGLDSITGGLELLDDFYKVFSFNMRDLGSPVHSKALVRAVLEEFAGLSRIQVVYKKGMPVSSGLIICFRDTVFITWASSIRKFNPLSPNMMLYWNFLKHAADAGYQKFDFGRSTPHEGSYKFKEQWGAKPSPLYWQQWQENGSREASGVDLKRSYQRFVSLWKKFPIPVANMVGPLIRKNISL